MLLQWVLDSELYMGVFIFFAMGLSSLPEPWKFRFCDIRQGVCAYSSERKMSVEGHSSLFQLHLPHKVPRQLPLVGMWDGRGGSSVLALSELSLFNTDTIIRRSNSNVHLSKGMGQRAKEGWESQCDWSKLGIIRRNMAARKVKRKLTVVTLYLILPKPTLKYPIKVVVGKEIKMHRQNQNEMIMFKTNYVHENMGPLLKNY